MLIPDELTNTNLIVFVYQKLQNEKTTTEMAVKRKILK